LTEVDGIDAAAGEQECSEVMYVMNEISCGLKLTDPELAKDLGWEEWTKRPQRMKMKPTASGLCPDIPMREVSRAR
jgi:hypothetical protein